MTRAKKRLVAACAGYALGAVFTFGHAAHGHELPWRQSVEACSRERFCTPLDKDIPPAMVGVFAGLVWPLYWSWEVQS